MSNDFQNEQGRLQPKIVLFNLHEYVSEKNKNTQNAKNLTGTREGSAEP